MRRSTWMPGLLLAVLLASPGCAAGAGYRGDMLLESPAMEPPPVGGEAGVTGKLGRFESTVEVDGKKLAQSTRTTTTKPAQKTQRKVVYTGWFTIDVYEIRKAQKELVALVEGMGGYMQETSGNMVVVRLPAEKFALIEPELKKLGRLDDSLTRIQASDITARFVDTELRLKTKKKYLQTLTKMLEQAGTLKDKLEVQKEIARMIEEIESLEGALRLMKQQVALATVTVTFRLAHSGPKRTFRLPWGWLDALGIENLIR
ncbi:MAG: DUF4349 domain-containing protein [Deltaproteobacteria bacterium]|nr:DUF4349 domain-containing protein [Deltaproteobacteria bacterium]